jgi:hypothetical protein
VTSDGFDADGVGTAQSGSWRVSTVAVVVRYAAQHVA